MAVTHPGLPNVVSSGCSLTVTTAPRRNSAPNTEIADEPSGWIWNPTLTFVPRGTIDVTVGGGCTDRLATRKAAKTFGPWTRRLSAARPEAAASRGIPDRRALASVTDSPGRI